MDTFHFGAMGEGGDLPRFATNPLLARIAGIAPPHMIAGLKPGTMGGRGQIAIGWSNQFMANIPTRFGPPGARTMMLGTEPVLYTPAVYASGLGSQITTGTGSLSGLGDYLGRRANFLDNRGFLSSKAKASALSREVNEWKALHLEGLYANMGQVNIGAAAGRGTRAKLFVQDQGALAREGGDLKGAFFHDVFQRPEHALDSYNRYRQWQLDQYTKLFQTMGPAGNRINTAGIKDISFQVLRSFTGKGTRQLVSAMDINLGSPEALRPFSFYRKLTAEEGFRGNYLPTFAGEFANLARMHPLVAGSTYGSDLEKMRALIPDRFRFPMPGMKAASAANLDLWGTGWRASLGMVHGPGAGQFWSMAAGEGEVLATSRRAIGITGASLAQYKRELVGAEMMPGLLSPKTRLGQILKNSPEFMDALQAGGAGVIDLKSPIRLTGEMLGKDAELGLMMGTHLGYRGIKRKSPVVGGVGDVIERVAFGPKSVKLFLRRASANQEFHLGAATLTSGVRTAMGLGAPMQGIDVLGYGLKMGDPGVFRERYTSHIAGSILEELRRQGRANPADINKAFTEAADMLGMEVGQTSTGLSYMHTGERGGLPKYMTKGLAPESFESYTQGTFHKALAKRLGFKTSQASQIFGLQTRAMGFGEAVEQLVVAGKMSRGEAESFVQKELGGIRGGSTSLMVSKFREQFVQYRASNIITEFQKKSGGSAKIRARLGRQVFSYMRGALDDLSGPVAGYGELMHRSLGKQLGAVANRVELVTAALEAPLVGDEAVQKVIQSSAGRIKSVKFSDIIAKTHGTLGDRLTNQLRETAQISESLFTEIQSALGMGADDLGTFVQYDTAKQGLPYLRATRRMEDVAGGNVGSFFLLNPKLASEQLGEKSLTGGVGNVFPFPQKALAANKVAGEYKSLQLLALNTKVIESLLSGRDKGLLSERLALHNIALMESLVGSKGFINRHIMSGFQGGRLEALGFGKSGFQIGMTASGIKSHFGDYAPEMLKRAKAGNAFTYYVRDPAQTAQQVYVAKLNLVSPKSYAAGGLGKVRSRHSVWVSRELQGVSQGDVDTDFMNVFIQKMNKKVSFGQMQDVMGAMYGRQAKMGGVLTDIYRSKAMLEDVPGSPLRQMVGRDWADTMKNVTFSASDLAGARTAMAVREAEGAVLRESQYGLIAAVHTYATKRTRTVRAAYAAATGAAEFNEFAAPLSEVQSVMKNLGFTGANLVAEEAPYVNLIYGFLKKGSQKAPDVLELMGAINRAAGADEFLSQGSMSPVYDLLSKVMPSQYPYGPFSKETAPFYEEMSQIARNAAAQGNPDLLKYPNQMIEHVGQNLVRAERAHQLLAPKGSASLRLDVAMAEGREPVGIIGRALEKVTGVPAAYAPAPGVVTHPEAESLIARVSRHLKDGMPPGTADETTEAAVRGVQQAGVGKNLVKDLLGKAKGWGGLKAAGIGAGVLAGWSLLRSMGDRDRQGPPTAQGAPLPPSPNVGQPMDGVGTGHIAPTRRTVRIQRTPGQRQHFPVEDDIQMPRRRIVQGPFSNQTVNGARMRQRTYDGETRDSQSMDSDY